ncbi:MAG: hypothetical protein A2452_12360 [Candidatus Firestonebacteria bacterium RIFOXYC2_FULL_39_67]|nr:MAG: hypothetical protein A2536_07890 [Candidatus Firestonebacteria bacterium RIFOXYD2_FULL_39_29]OGF55640.1 MAG: hypothetical protein A2452_12360 [Candidatus Firestonebacteria bacterium RIFOXYC2_FULL_39_67]OGF57563.1 MAG: hypothetical protein A2497_01320 [Candidatus Firestonebacteria bacterium RifOxyC12_full_39_7]
MVERSEGSEVKEGKEESEAGEACKAKKESGEGLYQCPPTVRSRPQQCLLRDLAFRRAEGGESFSRSGI